MVERGEKDGGKGEKNSGTGEKDGGTREKDGETEEMRRKVEREVLEPVEDFQGQNQRNYLNRNGYYEANG